MRILIALLTCALLAMPSQATCRKIVQVKQAVVVEKVAAVAVPVVAVAAVPYYSSYYQPPVSDEFRGRGQADQQIVAAVNELTKAVNSLNARVAALEGKPAPAPDPRPGPMPPAPADPRPGDPFAPAAPQARLQGDAGFARIAAAKCAACHMAGAESKGGGIVLLDRTGLLTAEAQRRAVRIAVEVYGGKMPPKGHAAVTDEEMATIMQWLGEVASK